MAHSIESFAGGQEESQADDYAKAEIVLYQSEGANVPVEVRYLNETFWLTQRDRKSVV